MAINPVRMLVTDCDPEDTTTFTGTAGSSGTNSSNWDNGVHDSSLCAVIPADDGENGHFNVVISGGTTASCKTLTIGNERDDRSGDAQRRHSVA